jgi:hypothetical protein
MHIRSISMAGITLILSLSFFLLWTAPVQGANPGPADLTAVHKNLKKRRGGRGGFEVFQKNFEIFLGGGINIASGGYFGAMSSFYASNNKGFKFTTASSKNLLTGVFGAQYRHVFDPKSEGFASYLSFGAGLMYQRRGFSTELTMINQNISIYEDKTLITEKFRSGYLSVPLTIRVGKKVYAEGGVMLDMPIFGKMVRELERGIWGDSTDIVYYTTFDKKDFKTGGVLQKASLGYCFGAGLCVNEFFGIRLWGTMANRYFAKGPDVKSMQFTFQMIGTFN